MGVKIVPSDGYLLVTRDVMEEKTKSGLYISQKEKDQINSGTVVSTGERIIFNNFGIHEIEVEGKEYLIVHESDVLARLEDGK